MEKLVKVQVNGMPITLSNSVKAFGYHGPIMMDIEDIFRCIAGGAVVKEVNGKNEILLNFANYNKENFKAIRVTKSTPVTKSEVLKLPEVEEKALDSSEFEEEIVDEVESISEEESVITSDFIPEDKSDTTAMVNNLYNGNNQNYNKNYRKNKSKR